MLRFLQNTVDPAITMPGLGSLWRFISKQAAPDFCQRFASQLLIEYCRSFAFGVDQCLDHIDSWQGDICSVFDQFVCGTTEFRPGFRDSRRCSVRNGLQGLFKLIQPTS